MKKDCSVAAKAAIVAAQESMLDQISHFLAIRTRSDLEPGVQSVDIIFGSTDPTAQARLSPT